MQTTNGTNTPHAVEDPNYFLPTDEVFDLTATTPNPISGPSAKMGDFQVTDVTKESGKDFLSKKEVIQRPVCSSVPSRSYPRRLPI